MVAGGKIGVGVGRGRGAQGGTETSETGGVGEMDEMCAIVEGGKMRGRVKVEIGKGTGRRGMGMIGGGELSCARALYYRHGLCLYIVLAVASHERVQGMDQVLACSFSR
jgi:hypothetical protein